MVHEMTNSLFPKICALRCFSFERRKNLKVLGSIFCGRHQNPEGKTNMSLSCFFWGGEGGSGVNFLRPKT